MGTDENPAVLSQLSASTHVHWCWLAFQRQGPFLKEEGWPHSHCNGQGSEGQAGHPSELHWGQFQGTPKWVWQQTHTALSRPSVLPTSVGSEPRFVGLLTGFLQSLWLHDPGRCQQ